MQCKDFIGKPSGNPRKNFLQRGQVIILYALLIPLMFLFVGVGLDLGWYYLNVSRLQNAADAAALAGATELVTEGEVTNIKTISLVDKYDDNPADIDTIDGDAVAPNMRGKICRPTRYPFRSPTTTEILLLTLCTTTGVSAANRPSQ